MKIKENKKNIFEYFTDGSTLLFIKFLHEHKSVIYNMIIEQPKTYNLKKFIYALKKLVQYNFTEKEFKEELPKEYISNILYEILTFEYNDLNNIDIFQIIEKNMNKNYLLQNFELWWYQSMYMIGGSGYIRNINDYLHKYWDTNEFFTEKDSHETTYQSYNRHSVPQIFSEEEFDIFLNGYHPYYPPELNKMINKNSIYEDGSRMF